MCLFSYANLSWWPSEFGVSYYEQGLAYCRLAMIGQLSSDKKQL